MLAAALAETASSPVDIAPVLLGSGEPLFAGVETFGFEPAEVLHSPLTTHIRYRTRSVN